MSFEHGGEFGRLSADLQLITARDDLVKRVQLVRAGIVMPDRSFEDSRTISRRFAIYVAPGQTVPVDSERIALVPKPRSAPTDNIDGLRIYQPLLPVLGEHDELAGEEQSDSRFVFFEGCQENKVKWRYLLSSEGLRRYSDSRDIAVIHLNDDIIFRIRNGNEHVNDPLYTQGFEFFTYADSNPEQEMTELYALAKMLEDYEPELQDNISFN